MNDSIQELYNSSIPSKPIDDKHLELLLCLLEHPGITAINIYKSENGISINKKANYSNIISRRFKKLHDLKLVEKMMLKNAYRINYLQMGYFIFY
jgi:hypothetical protein